MLEVRASSVAWAPAVIHGRIFELAHHDVDGLLDLGIVAFAYELRIQLTLRLSGSMVRRIDAGSGEQVMRGDRGGGTMRPRSEGRRGVCGSR